MKEPKNNIQTGKVINYHSYCLPEMTVTWLFLRHRINLCTFIVQITLLLTQTQVLRRSGPSERLLVLVKSRPGHSCDKAVTVAGILLWDALNGEVANQCYQQLRKVKQ